MLTVAYLANQYPCAVEPYVGEEIEELRSRGVQVVTGSVRAPMCYAEPCFPDENSFETNSGGTFAVDVVLQPLRLITLLRGAWLCLRRYGRISSLIVRVMVRGREGPWSRVKALIHTWMGACYAIKLADRQMDRMQIDRIQIDHIHAHHGYFGSWIAMVVARLLNVPFSMTLHGSDLLLHGTYLDVKLANCAFCLTVSEYNRRFILQHYPEAQPAKIVVSRLGVEVAEHVPVAPVARSERLSLLAVGRLHAVKDHAFLIRACAELADRGLEFECSIAGEGPERHRLASLIRKCGLEKRVTLLGHVAREQRDSLYDWSDVVVLTSRSEGLPLVLMEAMARGKIVIAPAITGIPELVIAGKTGFLYEPGSMDGFVTQLFSIHCLMRPLADSRGYGRPADRLDWIRHAARVQIGHNFNRQKNLKSFGDSFLHRVTPRSIMSPQIAPKTESALHENFVLQQVQLPLQRNRSLPVRTDGTDAFAGARGRTVFDG